MAITIRKIEQTDAQVVTTLSAQLGYTITEEETARQITQVNDSANDVAYVAIDDGKIVGWLHAFYTLRLESAPFCEVAGLVVDEQHRGKGVGKALVQQAKQWCESRSCDRLRVRCNTKREDAHRFYIANGFKEKKEQKIFELLVPAIGKITLLLFALLIAGAVQAHQYKYLALKGGGIRGIAYAGALKVLEEKKITGGIEKVAGTSVGAIVGTLFCVGYSAVQIEEIMLGQDIAAFNDGEGCFIGGQRRLRKRYGWYKGKQLEQWLGTLIKAQTGSDNTTFAQLHAKARSNPKYKDLYVTATDLTTQSLTIFSWESYPDMPVKTAVRASAAIPIYFAAVFIDSAGAIVEKPKKHAHYNVYVDGGLLANYPIDVFKTEPGQAGSINEHTLGLKLERPQQISYAKEHAGVAPYDIHSFGSYIGALYNVIIEQLNKSTSPAEERQHTIYISTSNLNPRVRHITKEQKELLFNNGVEGARNFFNGAAHQ